MEFRKDIHYSQDMEDAVIGACLLECNAIGRIYDLIDEEVFYHDANQLVYRTMIEMYQSGLPIESFSLADYLIRSKGVMNLGPDNVSYYLSKLTKSVVSSANIEYHSHCLREMWTKRELVKLTYGGTKDDDVKRSMKAIYDRLQYIHGKALVSEWQDMQDLVVGLYRHQDEMVKAGGMGITTGFREIDRKTGGFHSGQLIVIGARPSVGKSALAGQMALQIAKTGKKVGIISLEMSNNEIAARLAAVDANVNFDVLYRGMYDDENQRKRVYDRLSNHTSTLPIYVSDKTNVNINDIRAKVVKLMNKVRKEGKNSLRDGEKGIEDDGLAVIMIDYLQLVESDDNKSNREQQVAKVSRGAKIMAKELGIPVVLLCQLNREVTKRKGSERYPQLSDLRESGAIEQDADAVMFLHSDWMSGIPVDENGSSTEYKRDLVIRKWRNGQSNWILPLEFDAPKMMFKEQNNYSHIPVLSQSDNPYKDDEAPF